MATPSKPSVRVPRYAVGKNPRRVYMDLPLYLEHSPFIDATVATTVDDSDIFDNNTTNNWTDFGNMVDGSPLTFASTTVARTTETISFATTFKPVFSLGAGTDLITAASLVIQMRTDWRPKPDHGLDGIVFDLYVGSSTDYRGSSEPLLQSIKNNTSESRSWNILSLLQEKATEDALPLDRDYINSKEVYVKVRATSIDSKVVKWEVAQVKFNITLQSAAGHTQGAQEWEIAQATSQDVEPPTGGGGEYTSPDWVSGTVSNDKKFHWMPAHELTADGDTIYAAHVRLQDNVGNWSAWSNSIYFRPYADEVSELLHEPGHKVLIAECHVARRFDPDGWSLTSGQTNTYETTLDRTQEFPSFKLIDFEDNLSFQRFRFPAQWLEKKTIADVEANRRTWFWDETVNKLYVHTDIDSSPQAYGDHFAARVLIGFTTDARSYLADGMRTISIKRQEFPTEYEPRIVNSPSFGDTMDRRISGRVVKIQGGVMGLANGDKFFDTAATKYLWNGRPVFFKMVGTTASNRVVTYNQAYFHLEGVMVLEKNNILTDSMFNIRIEPKAWRFIHPTAGRAVQGGSYPNARSSDVGRHIPTPFGASVRRSPLLMIDTTTPPGAAELITSIDAPLTVTTVYRDETALDPGDWSVTGNVITISNAAEWDVASVYTFDGDMTEDPDPGGSPLTSGAAILEYVFKNYGGWVDDEFIHASITEVKDFAPYTNIVPADIDAARSINRLIDIVGRSNNFVVVVDHEGRLDFLHEKHNDISSHTVWIRDEDIRNYKAFRLKKEQYPEVIIRFKKQPDPAKDLELFGSKGSTVTKKLTKVETVGGKQGALEVETTLDNETDADALGDEYATLLEDESLIISFDCMGTTLFPVHVGRRIIVDRRRGMNQEDLGTLSGDYKRSLFKIIKRGKVDTKNWMVTGVEARWIRDLTVAEIPF